MEEYLIVSMQRNLMRHLKEEKEYGFSWTSWQAEKLREMQKFRKQNKKIIGKFTKNIPEDVEQLLKNEYRQGLVGVAKKYAEKFGENKFTKDLTDGFFGMYDGKIKALINAVNDDLKAANHAALRMTNDAYRQVIHKAAMFAGNGVMTEKQAIEMALQEFKKRGLNCIKYKNGARHNIKEYADMALRTAEMRAMLIGEGKARQELGETLVQISRHGTACPLCVPWENKVLIDDVYSGGTWENSKAKYEQVPESKRGESPFLSKAMLAGLYHPRCRHGLGTYYVELQDDYKPIEAEKPKEPKKAAISAENPFVAASINAATAIAQKMGVKYVSYEKLPLETANNINGALATLPDDVKPIFVGDSVTLEQLWGGKLPRSSRQYYGVTVESNGVIHLGYGKGFDLDTHGDMVGISASYKTADKVTEAKKKAQAAYEAKTGRKWFFNMNGKTTPYHEMGHVYVNAKGLPRGFEDDALKWAKETGCDILKKPNEAWAEAWAAYHLNPDSLPEYIKEYIEKAAKTKTGKSTTKALLSFDVDGKIIQEEAAFKAAFERGEISTLISPQKQARHIRGTKQYKEHTIRMQKSRKSENEFPGYIREDLTMKDLENLVVKNLTGTVTKQGSDFSEYITCDEIMGYYYSPAKSEFIPTKRVMVKYAPVKRNIHIVPVKEI